MKPIIQPVDRELIKGELTTDKFLRPTNKAHNEIYVITAHNSPNIMREIGRLREVSFRSWGGGTGEEIDIDPYDLIEKPYRQLIVWDPQALEIVGGYRFLPGTDVTFDEEGQPKFVMAHLFHFTDRFIQEYLPFSIELGRAFVQPDYQTAKMGSKSLFALDNLWDGLGALIHSVKNARYFVGKINIYEHYPRVARELIYEFMHLHFPDRDKMIVPKNPISVRSDIEEMANELFTENSVTANYKILQKAVRAEGETIPPMFNAYIGLTDTMRMFGTTIDPDFSSTFETAIMITMADLLEVKKKRYIDPYIDYLKQKLEERKVAKLAARRKKEEQKRLKKENRL